MKEDRDDGLFENTTLPSVFDVGNVGISIDEELRIVNQKAVAVIFVTVTGGGTFADQYEVQFKKQDETEFKSLGRGTSNIFEIIDGMKLTKNKENHNRCYQRNPKKSDVCGYGGAEKPGNRTVHRQIN